MLSKGMQMVSKLKDQIKTSVFTSNSQESDYAIKLSNQQCPPLVIDEIVFNLNSLESIKISKRMRGKMTQQYGQAYITLYGRGGLIVEIVGKKYFMFVRKSTQTFYNYSRHTAKDRSSYKNYEKSIRQIYENAKMMKHFWSIDFCNLKVLNISRHNLTSIEGITFMNLPHLQCLQLHTNNLQSIDCLSKISTPKLRIITLYNNRLLTATKLTRLNSNKLKIYEFDREDTIQEQKIENLDFMVKMKTFDLLQKIYMQDDNRIWHRKKMRFVTEIAHKSKVPNRRNYSRQLQRDLDEIMNELNRFNGYLD